MINVFLLNKTKYLYYFLSVFFLIFMSSNSLAFCADIDHDDDEMEGWFASFGVIGILAIMFGFGFITGQYNFNIDKWLLANYDQALKVLIKIAMNTFPNPDEFGHFMEENIRIVRGS